MTSDASRRGARWACRLGVLVVALASVQCGAWPEFPEGPLTDEQCENLLEIETTDVTHQDTFGPSSAQVAEDTLNPEDADLSQYGIELLVTQDITNLINRPVVVEGVTNTFTSEESNESYESAYQLDEPLEIPPGETRSVEFVLTVRADEVSPEFMLGLMGDAVHNMRIAPQVRVTIPGTDNCGYPDGAIVQGKDGTVEVERPVGGGGVLAAVLGGILKALLHA